MNTIDADGHIVEKDTDIRKHLPEPYSKRPVDFCRPTAWTPIWAACSAGWRKMICRLG